MNSDEIYRLINSIGGTTSRTLKINLLMNNSCALLLKILKYAYDPNLKFNIKKIINPVPNYKGHTVFDEKFFFILDNLARRNLSGADAKRIAGVTYARLSFESKDLFLRILNKDLRCGISIKTINEAFPNLINEFEVMLAKQWDPSYATYPCYVQPKLDGIRAIYKDGKFLTRTGKVLKGLDHLHFDCNVALDGELYLPGIPFEQLSGMVRNHNQEPTLYYYVFDTLISNLKYIDRKDIFTDITLTCKPPKITPIRTLTAFNEADLERFFIRFTEESKYEGVIVKTVDHPYQYKRSWDWMKIKKRETVDVICHGMDLGQGKYQKIMGQLLCTYKGNEIRVGTGFSDAQREEYTLVPPVGKIIEVYYQELTKYGVLRHPVFKCVKG